MDQIVILGGGAAGILAAISAAKYAAKDTRVLLLEQNPRIGKKLLATGNGRCNLDNRNMAASHYHSADTLSAKEMLDAIGADMPLAFFEELGLVTRTDEQGRVYPYSNQAADFLNLLLYWLDKYHVAVKTECKVKAISQKGREYMVMTESGERIYAKSVICAFGGKAGPQFGTDGFGVRFAKDCGLQTVTEYPCLVPLRCSKEQIAGLAGIRVKAIASLYCDGLILACEDGEIQFTEQGLSGIAIMQLSNCMNKPKAAYRIGLNLFPELDTKQVTKLLCDRIRYMKGCTVEQMLNGLCNKRVGIAVLKAAGCKKLDLPAEQLTAAELQRIAGTFGNLEFTELSLMDYKQAQTTGGGIALHQLDPKSFMLKGCPGLYFVGETLDVVGNCGGYNLHFAFGSGIIAGKAAAYALRHDGKRKK